MLYLNTSKIVKVEFHIFAFLDQYTYILILPYIIYIMYN